MDLEEEFRGKKEIMGKIQTIIIKIIIKTHKILKFLNFIRCK